ncbi:Ku domain containing protein Pku70 [Pyrenophora tritici-repentis]|uniref:ATP-dependent DNA helicase II subunit 1 n=1 Tax=Pyrenophora tritici-repentis TaxID=45151 RepID=A0A2W1DA98_9PLEO|nr:Ku domain-containing protein Pku70 [Pyrenophora tritici-repentis]KAF7443105.1 Ku domain containing protein Pku70 [Pyrenophora tritici-repentis]KAI0609735.1 Ku domain-containing protein Pku70 [Pyrenophora tritici-repentis]KAI0619561.1 Ku domain-containing protein Pku70 [Pyrenophora tritici-repentis]KAI1511540.1 Ku domain containing protein Pku70 [Pyrenophora tritici-repentis]
MADPQDNRAGEEEEEEDNYKTIKDAVLFAIDVSLSMLQKPPKSDDKKAERDSPTSAALKCAYQLMQQRIISNPNDMMGILLFGTEKTDVGDGDNAFEHCYLLADLDVPSAQDVKRLRDMVDNEEEAEEILKPAKGGASISNVLFCANQIFTTKAPNFSSRRLFLVTDNDYPVKIKADKDTAVTRARDLYDLGCTIDLFPISQPDHSFDRSRFYDDLVYPTSPSDPDAPVAISSTSKVAKSGEGISLLKQLISSINSKATPRRALFSLPLELGPDFRISVKGYILIKRQEHIKSCYVWVGGEKPQIATSSTTQISDDISRNIEKTELQKAYKFGGDAITFTPEEITQIRQCFGEPIIRIIGFKPLSSVPIWANTNKSTFIYPSEADYIGSTRVFSALQQKLIKSKKMGLVWFIPRRNAAPTLAALIPGVEKVNEDGEQTMPPGLWLVPLPFADDIRQFPTPPEQPLKTTDALTDKMRLIIEQLQLPKGIYDPSRYPNPDLQWFYRILQALALEEELPDHPDDKTIPRYKQIDKRCGEYIEEYGKEFQEAYVQQHSEALANRGKPVAKKRPAGGADADGKPAAKKVKKDPKVKAEDGDDEDGMTDEQMAELNNSGQISKQTVAVLKQWLVSRNQSTAGKKADLLERVQDYLDRKGL